MVATALVLFALWLLLLPVGNVGDVVVALMGVCWLLWRFGGALKVPQSDRALAAERCFSLLFACIWLPMFVSASSMTFAGASGMGNGWETVLKLLRFWPAGMFWTFALQSPRVRFWIGPIALCFVCFWSLDALWQSVFGWGLTGEPEAVGLPDGVFENVGRLGHSLAMFAPIGVGWGLFAVWRIRDNKTNVKWLVWAAMVIWVLVVLALFAASRRGALLMVVYWSVLFCGVWLTRATRKTRWRFGAVCVMVCVLGGGNG